MSGDSRNEEKPVEVRWQELSAEALDGLIEEFVTRDGTDYGAQERDLASRKQDVRRQLERRKVRIFFDQTSGSINLRSI
ncbi:MAG: YheU family protein [Deltaproteobacteria bacterium]